MKIIFSWLEAVQDQSYIRDVVMVTRGGFRRGGRPPPLCTILRYPFLVRDRKIFLKAPSAPIYTNFEGGARAEKMRCFGQHFAKSA